MAVLKRSTGSESSASEQKRRQIAEAAQIRLTAIVDSSDDAIISEDLAGTIVSWNSAATRIFGYQPEEIIGKSILTLAPVSLHHEEAEVLRKLRAGEKIEHYETIRQVKDGSLKDVSLTISPLKDVREVVVGASIIARDITDKRRSDEARFRLAAIVESSDDPIISKDLNGIITSWNAAATRVFGWNPEEIIGRSVLTLIPRELRGEEPIILSKLRAGERIEHYETQRLHKDGHLLDISLTVSPIKDPLGRVIGASKIARDISEHKRMQRALIESEKLAATGRMAAAIAHEINNPLEAVTNLAYLLSLHPSLDDEARGYANLMLDEISRANEITKQTLAYYRDTGRPTQVDLTEIVENVLKLNCQRFRNKNITIYRDYRTKETVCGLTAEIRQVVANLILNATDAVPEGGSICLRVAKDTVFPGRRVRFSILDNGPGIPVEARKRLFEPFFTTKGNLGNGLGLWVSRGIVEKHGGVIGMKTRTNGNNPGTVFSVVFQKEQPRSFA